MNIDSKSEFEAFKTVYDALAPLDGDMQSRVVKSVTTLLGIDAPTEIEETTTAEEEVAIAEPEGPRTFTSMAELFGETDPDTNSEKALVAGYWLQVVEGAADFTSQSVNRELRNLGHRIGHITSAIGALQNSKPQLMFQLKKSGNSQQARKTLKLSEAGIKRVQEMMGD